MALADYMTGAPTSIVGNAVEKTDENLARARKRAELRARAERLSNQINNLKKQREVAVDNAANLKKQREALTDDEIVRMAKVKGIRDEDISSYINGRITQRNADIATAGNENAQNEIKAQEEANKAAKVKEVTDKLDEVVREISTLNVDIGEGNSASKAKAEASKKLAEKRYETLKKQYKDLTDTEWTDEPEEYSRTSSVVEENTEVPQDVFSKKPEGWSFTDYGAWMDADEKGKAAIEAKYKDNAENERRHKLARQKELQNVQGDMRAIGATQKNLASLLYDKKLLNDPIKKASIDRIKAFMQKDKEYNTLEKLKTLAGK